MDYYEPFFGSGSIGFKVLEELDTDRRVSISDIDPGIVSLWKAVHESPDELCSRIKSFTPNVDDFYSFQETDGTDKSLTVENGFKKLALHQMSYSGLGAKAGGPIGGREQRGAYKIDCRYNVPTLTKNIGKLHTLMSRFKDLTIECKPVFSSLESIQRANSIVYLDPPYYVQGGALYANNMNVFEHQELAKRLNAAEYEWVLSYDDVEPIRQLYSWAKVTNLEAIYTLAPAKNKRLATNELIITKI